MVATLLLDDAQLLLERAQAHRREFDRLLAAGPGLLWNVQRSTSPDGVTQRAQLVIDRAIQRQAKPVLADIANNLIHALDHVTAAARRSFGLPNPRDLYFPIALDDEDYAKRARRVAKYLDQSWLDLFAAARDQHRLYLPYLQCLRSMSREAKHWELAAGIAGALAVQWTMPGAQQPMIVQIPPGHFGANDHFPLWEAPEEFPTVAVLIVTNYRIVGEDMDPVEISSVLSTSETFVAGVIAKSRHRLATFPPST